jgi:hypothetical protein
MPTFTNDDDDAGVLAHRPMTLGAHARVRQDLRDRILRGRALLELIGTAQRLDVVHRVVVRDVLQRVGDAVDQILLLDDAHDSRTFLAGAEQ